MILSVAVEPGGSLGRHAVWLTGASASTSPICRPGAWNNSPLDRRPAQRRRPDDLRPRTGPHRGRPPVRVGPSNSAGIASRRATGALLPEFDRQRVETGSETTPSHSRQCSNRSGGPAPAVRPDRRSGPRDGEQPQRAAPGRSTSDYWTRTSAASCAATVRAAPHDSTSDANLNQAADALRRAT